MSDAYKCNKCEDVFIGEPAQTLEIGTKIFMDDFPIMPATKSLDLCEDCFNDLLKWFEEG